MQEIVLDRWENLIYATLVTWIRLLSSFVSVMGQLMLIKGTKQSDFVVGHQAWRKGNVLSN